MPGSSPMHAVARDAAGDIPREVLASSTRLTGEAFSRAEVDSDVAPGVRRLLHRCGKPIQK